MLFLLSLPFAKEKGRRDEVFRNTCVSRGLSPSQMQRQGRQVSFPFAEMPWEFCPWEPHFALCLGTPPACTCPPRDGTKLQRNLPRREPLPELAVAACLIYTSKHEITFFKIFSLLNKTGICSLYLFFFNPIKQLVCILWQIFYMIKYHQQLHFSNWLWRGQGVKILRVCWCAALDALQTKVTGTRCWQEGLEIPPPQKGYVAQNQLSRARPSISLSENCVFLHSVLGCFNCIYNHRSREEPQVGLPSVMPVP